MKTFLEDISEKLVTMAAIFQRDLEGYSDAGVVPSGISEVEDIGGRWYTKFFPELRVTLKTPAPDVMCGTTEQGDFQIWWGDARNPNHNFLGTIQIDGHMIHGGVLSSAAAPVADMWREVIRADLAEAVRKAVWAKLPWEDIRMTVDETLVASVME